MYFEENKALHFEENEPCTLRRRALYFGETSPVL